MGASLVIFRTFRFQISSYEFVKSELGALMILLVPVDVDLDHAFVHQPANRIDGDGLIALFAE